MMICELLNTQLDDYLDGELAPAVREELDGHLPHCGACRAVVARARRLQQALGAYPVSGPRPDFFDRALATARASENRESGSSASAAPRWTTGRIGALAAGVAVFIVTGLLLQSLQLNGPSPAPGDAGGEAGAMAGVSMAMHETRTVNLVFSSAAELQGVSLTVDLPAGVELAGYMGLDHVRWSTRLQAGKNVLPLELVAIGGSGGELVARLQHEGEEKVFTVSVAVI